MPGKCWLRAEMTLTMSTVRGPSICMTGALSEQRDLIYVRTFIGSNNTDTFVIFLTELKKRCQGKTIVVMDNLPLHKAKKAKELFDEQRFIAMYLPTYSCTMNPIERVWNVVKKEWRRTQHMNAMNEYANDKERDEHSLKRLQDIVGMNLSSLTSLDSISVEKARNLATSHYPYLLRSLRGHLV